MDTATVTLTHPVIKKAICAIAQVCDYASTRDGVGFDASDTHWGHEASELLQAGEELPPDLQRKAAERMHKYHRQLDTHNIELPEKGELENFLEAIAPEWEKYNAEYEGRLRARAQIEGQKLLGEIREKLEPLFPNLGNTHRGLAEAIMFLNAKDVFGGDFLGSLVSRIQGGKDLSPKQQLAAVGTLLPRHCETLAVAGIVIPSQNEVQEFLSEIQASQPPKPAGEVKLKGDRIAVSFDYNPTKVNQIKSAAQKLGVRAGWDGSAKEWSLPLSPEVVKMLAETFPDFVFDEAIAAQVQEEIEEAQAQKLIAAEAVRELIELANLDGELANGWTLFPYQKEVVAQSISIIQSSELRGPILGLDMGLGKTIQALMIAKPYQQKYGDAVLVVCPATLKKNWLREAEYAGVAIEVFSWAKMPSPLEYKNYILIADEAHYAQSGNRSSRGKNFLELSQHPMCRAVLPLTGTPMKNGRPLNLIPLLQAINHPIARDEWDFKKRYCNAHQKSIGWGRTAWDFTGASHLDELSKKIEDGLIRRKKKDVLKDLPEKTRVFKSAEVEGDRLKTWKEAVKAASARYEALREEAKQIMQFGGELTGEMKAAAIVLMTELRKQASYAKIDYTISLAQEVLEQGEQVVVFTEFVETAKETAEALRKDGYKVELLLGDTPNDERQAMVDRFQTGESEVFVSTSRAGGVGITLTRSSTVILSDRPWTPGDAEQSEDRCYRIGQKSNVLAIWVQWSSIDEKVDAILQQKAERIEMVLGGKRKTMRGIKNPNDIVLELLEDILG